MKEPFRVKVSNQVVVFSGIQVDASLKNKRPIMKEKKQTNKMNPIKNFKKYSIIHQVSSFANPYHSYSSIQSN